MKLRKVIEHLDSNIKKKKKTEGALTLRATPFLFMAVIACSRSFSVSGLDDNCTHSKSTGT